MSFKEALKIYIVNKLYIDTLKISLAAALCWAVPYIACIIIYG